MNQRNVLMSKTDAPEPVGFQEYPRAIHNKDGKTSKVVFSAEEAAGFDPSEWRDSPAAFETHPDNANYKAQKLANPSLGDLLARQAALDAREAAMNAGKK